MSYDTLPERSIVLRLEFSIADAVHQRGLMAVLASAFAAWWNRPRMPAQLPGYLRVDVGLPEAAEPAHWTDLAVKQAIPGPLRRPGM